MIIRCKAPLRLSFGGGGTDVEPYMTERGGSVINATINKYAYGTLVPRAGKKIQIKALDLDLTASYEGAETYDFTGKLDLATAVLRNFRPDRGFDIYMHCEAPPGSGLGSSSTVIVSLIGLFKEWLSKSYDKYEMAELAYKLERIDLGLEGGKQDQYASSFGGFNFIEFKNSKVVVNPLRISRTVINELEYRSLLVYTGKTRLSANIISDQKDKYERGVNIEALDSTKGLAIQIKDTLVRGDLNSFGDFLNEGWNLKKKFASNVSSTEIDNMYAAAMKNGALGGKITGAGGGGFMYLFCEFDKKHDVVQAVKELGGEIYDFSFDLKGYQTWRTA